MKKITGRFASVLTRTLTAVLILNLLTGCSMSGSQGASASQEASGAAKTDSASTDSAKDGVSIRFSNDGITAADDSRLSIDGTSLTITAAGTYFLSGSCEDGSVKVQKGTTGVVLMLDGLTLSSQTTAPLICAKSTEVTIEAAAGTVNTLSDTEANNDGSNDSNTENNNAEGNDSETESGNDASSNSTAENAVIKCKDGSQVVLCGTGELILQANGKNGIKSGDWVYLTFKGKFPDNSDDSSASLNASHLKVLSVSDLKDLQIPDPTPTPEPTITQTPEQIANQEKQFLATVQGVNLNILQILPAGSDTTFNLDMSAIPAYFKGGIAPGSHVNVTYIGNLEETPLEEIHIIAVTGEDPDTINDKHISFTVTGTIIGSTANTITVQTDDGATDTFRIENAQDLTAGGMEYGDYVCITFHPSKSKSSNIYTAVKIQDA